jgi:hypothetical protein
MPRASSLISRMTTFAGQSARVADVASGSTARRAPSGPTPYPLPCVVSQAAPSRTPPRSPYSTEQYDTRQESPPISGGMSWRYGLRPRKPPLDGSGDRAQSKSSVFWPSSARMTRVHPTPALGFQLPKAFRRVRVMHSPFFDPASNGVARDSEGARESTQTAAFVVSAKDLFARFWRISVAARLLPTALPTIAAEIALAAIGSQAVTHQPLALAMLASQDNNNHC